MAARASQHVAAANAALSARRYAYPLAVAAALANSHQRNLALAAAAQHAATGGPPTVQSPTLPPPAVSAVTVPSTVTVSLGGPAVTLTPSMNALAAAAAAQAAATAAVHHQHQAVSPHLHGLSP